MTKVERVKKKYTTKKGTLVGFITIIKPSPKYGTYTAHILLDKEEGELLVEKLKQMRKEQYKLCNNKGTLKDLPCEPFAIYDEDKGEHIPDKEGRYLLKTSNKAFNKDGKFVFKPQFINAKKEYITGDVAVGEGTVAKLSVQFEGYKAGANVGISAKLLGGQIINLVEFQSKPSISLDDFDEEEGFDGLGDEFTEEVTGDKAPADDTEDGEADF